MNDIVNAKQQLEITFAGQRPQRAPDHRQERRGRARWWFAHMHQIVDRAVNWKPAPPARPQQLYLTVASTEFNPDSGFQA